MASGLRALHWGIVGAIVSLVTGFGIGLVLSLISVNEDGSIAPMIAGVAAFGILGLIAVYGWWRLTTAFDEPDGRIPGARVNRVLMLACLGSAAFFAAAAWRVRTESAFVYGLAVLALLFSLWMISTTLFQREISVRVADYYSWRRLRWGIAAAAANLCLILVSVLMSQVTLPLELSSWATLACVLAWLAMFIVWLSGGLDALGRAMKTLRRIRRYRSDASGAAIAGAEQDYGVVHGGD